jgi:hypothetical protein
VENVFYLFGAYTEAGMGSALGLAFLRAGIFGLNHAMYTAFTGLGVALSLELRGLPQKVLSIIVGFALAVGSHALHNALATFTAQSGPLALLAAVFVDWVGVFVLLLVALGAFFLERRRIVAYGESLVRQHRLSAEEAAVLKSTLRRRLARLEMLTTGDLRRWGALRRYQRKVTEAAFAWHRLHHGDTGAQSQLTKLEREFEQLRREVAVGGI